MTEAKASLRMLVLLFRDPPNGGFTCWPSPNCNVCSNPTGTPPPNGGLSVGFPLKQKNKKTTRNQTPSRERAWVAFQSPRGVLQSGAPEAHRFQDDLLGVPSVGNAPNTLGVDSLSILFNHRSFQKPIAVFPGFGWVSRKKDPWKEWGSNPQKQGQLGLENWVRVKDPA